MATTSSANRKLPRSFKGLVAEMVPQAIMDDVQYENTVEMIDRLMAAGKLTNGQELYLETLVELVQAYEAKHYAIETADLDGIAALRHLLADSGMNASDLGRLLGVHPSMGSKLLKGERSLTVEHLRKLCGRFKVRPELLMA